MIIVFGILTILIIDFAFYHIKKNRLASHYVNIEVMNSADIIAAIKDSEHSA